MSWNAEEGMTGETVGNEMTNGIMIPFMYSISSMALDPEVYGRVFKIQTDTIFFQCLGRWDMY